MTVTGIDASYYTVRDLEKSTAFYTELLGAKPTVAYPGMFSEWSFPAGEAFGLYLSSQPDDITKQGGVMFAVDDVHAAVQECRAKGVNVAEHIEETPVCHMAFGTDIEGNGFILHKRKA